MESYCFRSGNLPLLVSIPHNGSLIPQEIAAGMTEAGRSSRDTDWYLDQLYDLPETRDANFIIAQQSRYVIDLNRPADNTSLYPGQTTTGLVPTERFDGEPIYTHATPDGAEQERRIETVWRPYHERLRAELNRLRASSERVVLIEAHSIASRVPRLFAGVLPDFNLGTNGGASCDRSLTEVIHAAIQRFPEYSSVVNGRFVGGYITRHYGKPSQGVHALQIELSQATYLDEPSLTWHDERAAEVRRVFSAIFQAVREWIQSP
jgi:N-formylglutamate deformylase